MTNWCAQERCEGGGGSVDTWVYGGRGDLFAGLSWGNRPDFAGSKAPKDLEDAWVATVLAMRDVHGGIKLGRRKGQRPSDKKAKKVLSQHAEGLSYRLIARNVGLSKNTVMDIVRRPAA